MEKIIPDLKQIYKSNNTNNIAKNNEINFHNYRLLKTDLEKSNKLSLIGKYIENCQDFQKVENNKIRFYENSLNNNDTPETFWDENQIQNLYNKLNDFISVDYNESAYDNALTNLNNICIDLKKYVKTPKQAVELEKIRTILLGNNMIPKFCGYNIDYNFDGARKMIISSFLGKFPMKNAIERLERDVCDAMCLLFAPTLINQSDISRLTYATPQDYVRHKGKVDKIRSQILNLSIHFTQVFDYADSDKLNEFMLNTNFADAFHEKDTFISFNHIYDNVEKFCAPNKFNSDKVQVALLMNIFKKVDKAMNIKYFDDYNNYEFIIQELERDKALDKTEILKKEGEKEWLR